MKDLTKLRKTRGAYGGLVTRVLPNAREEIEHFQPNDRKPLEKRRKTLVGLLERIQQLDAEILEVTSATLQE